MAYTKYSLTPANNTAAPPDGAPEGMLPSAVNDTMRDMMAQIRDVGDGVRDGTYTMTAPKITGGTITGVTLTGNTLTNPVITGATLTTSAFNGTVGATTASTGAFTTLSTSSTTTFSGLTASTALALDASKNVVSVTNTGTGNNVLSASPTLTGTIAGASLSLSSLTSGRVTYAGASGLLTDSANLQFTGTSLLVGSATATANFNFIASQSLDTTAGGMVENTSNTASATAVMRYKNSGSTFAYTGLGSPSRDVYGTLGPNVLAMYTGDTAGITLMVDANGPITFATGSSVTERMRITSAGNVGIGTSSPTQKLDVYGSDNNNLIISRNSNNTSSLRFQSNAAAGYIVSAGAIPLIVDVNGAERMRIDSAGNVGIATTSPATFSVGGSPILVVGNNAQTQITLYGGSSVGDINFATSSSGAGLYSGVVRYDGTSNFMSFWTNSAERMRIDSSGNLLVGTTGLGTIGSSSGSTITASGAIYSASTGESIFSRRSSDGDVILFRRDTTSVGSISVTTSATAYNTSSDYRLKENVVPMTNALATVVQLKPVTYKWKSDGSDGQGFIAHELAEVVPDCVSGEKDAVDANGKPVYQGVDTSFLVATLVSAIQELKAEFDAYKATHP